MADHSKLQLPGLALLLQDIKPHAADPEKTFSLMGWFNSARRSRLLNTTTTNTALIKMHHAPLVDGYAFLLESLVHKPFITSACHWRQSVFRKLLPMHHLQSKLPCCLMLHIRTGLFMQKSVVSEYPDFLCRAAKPFRNLEEIMREEQAAAAPAAGSNNDIQPANAQAAGQEVEVEKDELVEQIEDRAAARILAPNEPMDLASTKEMLDMFLNTAMMTVLQLSPSLMTQASSQTLISAAKSLSLRILFMLQTINLAILDWSIAAASAPHRKY